MRTWGSVREREEGGRSWSRTRRGRGRFARENGCASSVPSRFPFDTTSGDVIPTMLSRPTFRKVEFSITDQTRADTAGFSYTPKRAREITARGLEPANRRRRRAPSRSVPTRTISRRRVLNTHRDSPSLPPRPSFCFPLFLSFGLTIRALGR